MIFDNEFVTKDVVRWQIKHNPKRMNRIMENTRPLIEAIVSSYDPMFRDDMIQACYIKLMRACDLFNVSKGTPLHTYFTTVIHNCCRTVLKSEGRHLEIFDLDEYEEEIDDEKPSLEVELESIVIYCRERFPFLDTIILESLITSIVEYITNHGLKSYKQYCNILSDEYTIDIKTIELIYKIVIILLRYNHIEDVLFNVAPTMPFTPELQYIFGDTTTSMLSIIFDGIPIRF